MAEVTIDILLEALIKCEHEAQVQVNALRYLYNLCYRCEAGQACVLQRKPKLLINRVKNNFSGDISINTQLRRFELSIKQNGWRGNVEEVIEKEMKDEEVESVALRSIKLMSDAEFEAMFSGGAALNERSIEDDLQSYQTKSSIDSAVVSQVSAAASVGPSYQPGEESKSPGKVDAGDSFLSGGLAEMSAITHK